VVGSARCRTYTGVGQDAVEQGRILPVAVPDQVSDLTAGVFEVHDQVPGGLGHPGGGRVRGDTEDPDPAGGVLDDGVPAVTSIVRYRSSTNASPNVGRPS
jgi:hypothetical protein